MEGGGGEAQPLGAGFGGLRGITHRAAEGGDGVGMGGEARELLHDEGRVVVAAFPDARGMGRDGHEEEVRRFRDEGEEESGEGFGVGDGVVEFEVEDGGAERLLVQAGGLEAADGGRKLGRKDLCGIPPRHGAVAGGAEAEGFGCRKIGMAAGAGGGEHPAEDLTREVCDGLADAGKWNMHGAL